MESHNVYSNNISLETLGDDISIIVTLSTSTRDIRIENSAPTIHYDN